MRATYEGSSLQNERQRIQCLLQVVMTFRSECPSCTFNLSMVLKYCNNQFTCTLQVEHIILRTDHIFQENWLWQFGRFERGTGSSLRLQPRKHREPYSFPACLWVLCFPARIYFENVKTLNYVPHCIQCSDPLNCYILPVAEKGLLYIYQYRQGETPVLEIWSLFSACLFDIEVQVISFGVDTNSLHMPKQNLENVDKSVCARM